MVPAGVELVLADDVIERLRRVKSATEIAATRHAALPRSRIHITVPTRHKWAAGLQR